MSTRAVSILKMGSAEPEIEVNHGDFVDWIRAELPLDQQASARVIDPSQGPLPEPESVESLIITGSSSMVTEPSTSDLQAFGWLEKVLKTQAPVLGICYGHQMLGHVLGGKVGALPGGPEIGLAEIAIDAKDDPLFAACNGRQEVAVIHWQTVLELPRGSTVLAHGARDPHQIVRFRPNVWGVQFHPEFGPGVMTYYVRSCADDLKALNLDAYQIAARTQAWSGDRTGVIKRFGERVRAE